MSDNYKEFVDNIRELLTAIKDDERCQDYIEQNKELKSFIDVLTLHLISPTEEQKEEPKPIPWENKVEVGTYFQIIDPMVKTFGEVKEFTNLDIEDGDIYLVFSDGSRCNSKLVLPYDVHFDSTRELRDYHMAELASKEEKWITAILPGAQKVAPMNYFSSPDTMWWHDGRTEMEIPTPENKTRVILIPPPDRCGSYAGIYSRHKDGEFNALLYKAQQSNVIIYPSMDAEQFGNILREYMKWPYIVDYEIPDEIEESPFVPHEKKDEEETPKTDETAEQQHNTESTTDAGSEDSTSWTQKVSGFFKQLFKK